MLKPIIAALPLVLSACAAPMADPPSGDPQGSCRPIDQARYHGQPASSELGAQMQHDSGARILRWVAHGSMITMEFSPDRLTVRLDPQNRVLSATCG